MTTFWKLFWIILLPLQVLGVYINYKHQNWFLMAFAAFCAALCVWNLAPLLK